MAQTINMQSDGNFVVNFGNSGVEGNANDLFLPAQILTKMRDIHDTVNQAGISELHVEKDSFQSFEHVKKGSDINVYDFGTYVTEEAFTDVMALSEMFS